MTNTTTCNKCSHMCESEICSHKGKKCDYLYKQYGMKKWVFWIIIIVIALGLIVPFGAQVVCSIWFPDAELGLEIWNQFVSIILGVIATLLSIVSMIMGFKNYEDALNIQEKYTQSTKDISYIVKDLDTVKSDVKKIALSTSAQVKEKLSAQVIWGDEPQTKM